DLDLRDAETRERWRSVGALEEIAERTPHAVGLRFDEDLCRLHAPHRLREAGATVVARRVLIVGDSFAEGQGVRDEDTFAARLDRSLGAGVDVVNCGRRGYDFPTLDDAFEARLVAKAPALVVYAMVLNDAQRSEAFAARQSYLDDWIVDRRRMLASHDASPPWWTPRLFTVIDDRLEAARVGRETLRWYVDLYGPPNADGWAATQDHIVAMRDTARAHDAAFLVALLPLLVDLDGDYPFEDTTRTIRRALEARGLAFHDTTPALLGQPTESLWVHPTDHHPNERAHRLLAEDLEPVIASHFHGDAPLQFLQQPRH
ncbi:MAG: hypothetical protein KC619_01785, partial [Myxococcales bacterium]|nr:hypothetical protein [Myxococcales bacterium]